MAKFRYTEQHRLHAVLWGDKDKEPYAIFVNGEFETDDARVIERLTANPDVELIDAPADESAQ